MQEWARTRYAAHTLHRMTAEIPGPHGNREALRRADGPVVGKVSTRARLHGDWKREVERCRETEPGDPRRRVGQHVEHDRARRRRDNAPPGFFNAAALVLPRPIAPLATVRQRAI